MEKKGSFSKSIEREQQDDITTHPADSQKVAEVRFRQGAGSTEREAKDPVKNSNPTEAVEQESTTSNQGRRYPLRERRAPRRFPDEEHVLLTDEGDLERFEEATRDTHNRKWLSVMQDEMDSLHENHT